MTRRGEMQTRAACHATSSIAEASVPALNSALLRARFSGPPMNKI